MVNSARTGSDRLGGHAANALVGAVIETHDGVRVTVGGRELICFIGSNYLGIDHAPVPLTGFGLSVPSALAMHHDAVRLEGELSGLVGRPAAMLFPSTHHALCDVVGVLGKGGSLVLDPEAYPLTRVAAERASGLGIRVFRQSLSDERQMDALLTGLAPPCLVLCESLTLPGIVAPLPRWSRQCKRRGATLVVDDTQGFGLLGRTPSGMDPYGTGGSGALSYLGCEDHQNLVLVSSLTKAYGIPLAFVAGESNDLRRLRKSGVAPWSASQPDLASVRLALRALEWNQQEGDATRRILGNVVQEFRETLGTHGIGAFPIQSWYFRSVVQAQAMNHSLLQRGIWALLHPNPAERPGFAAIRFFLTARHNGPELARAMDAIVQARKVAP